MLFTGTKKRPTHLGPYPLERLARDPGIRAREEACGPAQPPQIADASPGDSLGVAARKYIELYMAHRDGEVASQRAPVPDDRGRRAADVKGFVYFLDASHVGITEMSETA